MIHDITNLLREKGNGLLVGRIRVNDDDDDDDEKDDFIKIERRDPKKFAAEIVTASQKDSKNEIIRSVDILTKIVIHAKCRTLHGQDCVADVVVDADAEADTVADANVDPEADADVASKTNADEEAISDLVTDADSNADADADVDADSDAHVDAEEESIGQVDIEDVVVDLEGFHDCFIA